VYAVAQEKGAAVHLDGARLWNASIAANTPLSAYGAVADSIMVCLSKGLGAPIGSLLAGDAAFVARARDARKLLGGGMRQVGVLAAPGLVALRDGRARLVEDHRRARTLAAGLCEAPRASMPGGPPDTNIVIVRVEGVEPKAVSEGLKARGVLAMPAGPEKLRFVTHYDVDDADVARAVAAFHDVVRSLAR
jgi:threonine aldolase